MKIGITCSTFDLLHAGHILMLEEAKQYCDYLICALQTDPTIDRPLKNKPIQSIVERYIQLEVVKYVDKIVLGFDGLQQLKTIIKVLDKKKKNIDYKQFCNITTRFVDPRKWKKILVSS